MEIVYRIKQFKVVTVEKSFSRTSEPNRRKLATYPVACSDTRKTPSQRIYRPKIGFIGPKLVVGCCSSFSYIDRETVLSKKSPMQINIENILETRLTYNSAHLRPTKESLTFEYLDILFLYYVSIGCHWLIHDGTGSV